MSGENKDDVTENSTACEGIAVFVRARQEYDKFTLNSYPCNLCFCGSSVKTQRGWLRIRSHALIRQGIYDASEPPSCGARWSWWPTTGILTNIISIKGLIKSVLRCSSPAICKQRALCVVLECNFQPAASKSTISQQRRGKMAFYGLTLQIAGHAWLLLI